jgi:GNAT superfamily N-acetyltransferase
VTDGSDPASELDLRPATSTDRPQILALLGRTVGWPADEQGSRYFAWKHDTNPFGPSPSWVALDGPRIVAFRTFLRWELVRHGVVIRAARAVDTATHPDYQGRGLFSRLTRHALGELERDGTALIFNTPNPVSRPRYLRLGWRDVGRVPVAIRPCSARGATLAVRARGAVGLGSASSEAGIPAAEGLRDDSRVDPLLAARGPDDRVRTHLTLAFLRWRYGGSEIRYRALCIDDAGASGLAIFRVRNRGGAREALLCELLTSPGVDPRVRTVLARRVAATVDADYVIAVGATARWRAGFFRVPGRGPRLVARAVGDGRTVPTAAAWALGAGDLELM